MIARLLRPSYLTFILRIDIAADDISVTLVISVQVRGLSFIAIAAPTFSHGLDHAQEGRAPDPRPVIPALAKLQFNRLSTCLS